MKHHFPAALAIVIEALKCLCAAVRGQQIALDAAAGLHYLHSNNVVHVSKAEREEGLPL